MPLEVRELLRALNVTARPATRKLLGRIQTALQRRRIAEFNRVLQFARKIQSKSDTHVLTTGHVIAGVILWQLEKSALTRENLERVVIEMVATDNEIEQALHYLKDDLEIIKEEHGLLSLNALTLFPS